MVDLGVARQVSAVEIDWESAYASSYEILTSLDGVNFSSAQQVSLLAPGTHRASFAVRAARYVRVRALQRGTMFGVSFWEARVLGPQDAGPPPPTADLALNQPASASTTDPSAGTPQAANDGDPTTRWSSDFADNQWWRVDLGAVKSVDRVEVNWEAAYASSYRIQTSTDGTTYSDAANASRAGAGLEVTTFSARNARYVRLIGRHPRDRVRDLVLGLPRLRSRSPATDRHAPAGDDDHAGPAAARQPRARPSISARTRPPPRSSAGWTPASSPPAARRRPTRASRPDPTRSRSAPPIPPATSTRPRPPARGRSTDPRQEATWR